MYENYYFNFHNVLTANWQNILWIKKIKRNIG